MPLYEYQCRKCGHRFEKIQKFSDPPVKKCPECGGAVEQLLSAPAVQFKGSGWYVTDYARKGAGASGKSEDGASRSDRAGESKAAESPEKSKSDAAEKSSAGEAKPKSEIRKPARR